MSPDSHQLTIVSNRGPASFGTDEQGGRTVQRGGGGLVTALTGLVAHRDALWIASAMTEEDAAVSEEHAGQPVEVELDGVAYRVLLVESDPAAYDQFYNVIANPISGSSSTTCGTSRTLPTSAARRPMPGSSATRRSTPTSPRRCWARSPTCRRRW